MASNTLVIKDQRMFSNFYAYKSIMKDLGAIYALRLNYL